MILQLANLGDIGGHFHNVGDLTGCIFQWSGPDKDIIALTTFRCYQHLSLVRFFIFKGFDHRAVGTGRITVFVNFITIRPDGNIKVFFKSPVGCGKSKILILHRDVAGHLIKKLLVALLGVEQFFSEPVYFRDICRYFDNQFNIADLVANGGGMHDYRRLFTVCVFYGCPGSLAFLVFKRLG